MNKKTKILKFIILISFLFLLYLPLQSSASINQCDDINYCLNLIKENTRIINDLKIKNVNLKEKYDAIYNSYAWYQDGINPLTPKRQEMREIEREMASNNDLITRKNIDNVSLQKQIKTTKLQGETDPEKIRQTTEELDQMTLEIKSAIDSSIAKIQEEDEMLNDGACWSGTKGLNIGVCVTRTVGWIGNLLTSLVALLLWAASKIFDVSVYYSINNMSSWFKTDAVNFLWKASRDLANIFFIFILLYIAIGTIFDLSGINNPQKMVVNVIIVALLVNFSGFFVRIIIDSSNIIAFEFYSSLGGGGVGFKSISDKFITSLLPNQYILKSVSLDSVSQEIATQNPMELNMSRLSIVGILGQTFGNIFILLTASFVLIVASILFIVRSVILLFIYIISPIAFTSRISPSPKFNYFQDWFEKLIKQAFFAPAFLFPLYLVFMIIGEYGIAGIGGTSGLSGWGIVGAEIFTLAIVDITMIALFVSCIFIAQKFGAVGLGVATAMGAKFTQGSSQIMGRFGGRAARAIGNRIPGREALRDSWNEGRLSRVRQSWDTGVLRTMRDTDTAKAVGQAVKNPLFSAGAGIGFMANQMGVKGMDNIVGDKIFSKEVEERAGKYLEEMRKMETDNDRVRYLESLAGQGKREEFDTVYAKLSPEERRKLESSARKLATSIDPNISQQAKTNARRVADKMATARRGMKGKKGQENAIEIFRNEKDDNIKLETIKNLEQEDFTEAYKELKPEEKAKLDKVASQNWQLTGKIQLAKQELKPKDINAVEREKAKQNRIKDAEELITSGQRLEDPVVAFNPQAPNAAGIRNQINKIRNLSAEEFRTFIQENNVFDGNHRDIYPYLTAEQLKVVLSEIGAAERQEIRNVIETNRPANNPPHPDTELEKAYQYLNDPRRNGISF